MLITKERYRHAVPFEDGEWFEFYKLSWTQLKRCKKAKVKEAQSDMMELPPELLATVFSNRTDEESGVIDRDAVTKAADEAAFKAESYDIFLLLDLGVAAYSYSDVLDIESLDEPSAMWAAQKVVDITKDRIKTEGQENLV